MKMYGIVILGALAIGACSNDDGAGDDPIIVMDQDSGTPDSGLMGRPDTGTPRPDAGGRDTAVEPPTDCPTAPLPPAYEGDTCNRDTRDCLAEATDEASFTACIEAADHPEGCNDCLNTDYSNCVTARTPEPWDCLNECYGESCASSGSQEAANACVESMCGDELDDYQAAGMDMAAAQTCFTTAVTTCTPDSATREPTTPDPDAGVPVASDAGTGEPGSGGGSDGRFVPFMLPAFGAFAR